MRILVIKNQKRAFTLAEILLAVILMALAFLPIVGLLTSSIKLTEQDENTQRAVRLCQEKLNILIQMPYSYFDNNNSSITLVGGEYKYNELNLILGEEIFEGIVYNTSLVIEPYKVIYHVPTCDFSLKGSDVLKASKENRKPDPSKWGWSDVTYTVEDKVKRYTVTVKWNDRGKNVKKEYTLSTLKANLRKK